VTPGRTDAFGELVDVEPTFLGLLGVATPTGRLLDGIDLVAVAGGTQPPKAFALMSEGIRSARYKALLPPPDVVLGEPSRRADEMAGELYDLSVDPQESENLWAARPEVAAELLASFRAQLSAPYGRYRAAVAPGPPESAFAIASRSFAVDPPVPVLPDRPLLRELMAQVPPSGWVRSAHAGQHALLARGDAGPLAIEFPVPNGTYRVTFALHGACALEIPGGPAPMELRAPRKGTARAPQSLRDFATVDVGSVTVADARFRAVIRPRPEAPWLLVRRFGFTPAGATENDELSKEREERLRARGEGGF
jgi:hypothetical protein